MSQQTFFFYDLETSGFDAKRQRIMQFAGQRTDMNLKALGEPVDIKIAMSDDVLPDPGAVMVTGITPQSTREEGYSEADFCQIFYKEICQAETIFVGFNSVRFDDEFMRYTLYRNLYDPYEWSWADGRSRWDLLDLSRMVRALRPAGIEWPVDSEGKPTNRLELLASANKLLHAKAHDALSDVLATIELAKLIKTKQPRMFDYLLQLRSKKAVEQLVNLNHPEPFVYSSGRYESEHSKTTVAYPIAQGSSPGTVVVYDLRYDPEIFADLSEEQLKNRLWARSADLEEAEDVVRIPVKQLAYNKCPAIAPLGVLSDETVWKRINLKPETIEKHLASLKKATAFRRHLASAFAKREPISSYPDVDGQLYRGFISDIDKRYMSTARAASRQELLGLELPFKDERLKELLVRYKARNFSAALTDSERTQWENYRVARIKNDLPLYQKNLHQLASVYKNDEKKQFLLEELRLWAESIVPLAD